MTSTVIIHPEPGNEKAIAQELLALADHPRDVEYVMWPQPGFRVPEELLERWQGPLVFVDGEVVDVPAVEEPVKPVKRAPGRPKKKVEDQ